jgi:uncharacterized protein (TIGR03067 family)
MRLIGFVCTLVLLSATETCAQTAKIATEQKKLEGQWLIVQRAYTPTKATAPLGKVLADLGSRVEIRQDKLVACDPDKGGTYFFIQFDPTKTPKIVNLKVPGKEDQVLPGIYCLENDLLSFVIGAGHTRPKYFGPFDNQVLLVLKRVPKKSPSTAGPATP